MRLIDADSLLNELEEKGWIRQDFNIEETDTNCIEDIVDLQSTVNVKEEVCAKWIYDSWCNFKCSNCAEKSNSKPYRGQEKYCPNCGAKMDRE